ncbi:MAG: DUF5606 domain-containing protein [Bacteroidales bacterium]|jgi:hypothetical protein|nr:DUF5606 domain-containing protein [Bacteroidales bacterium]
MNLKDLLSISGEGTLFKFIAQGKNAVIVENLETGRRFSAGPTAKVSALDEISIFTTGEDMPLSKVMDLIFDKEEGGEAVSHKQADADLKDYFAEVLPDYDRDRVYTSDIRKVLHWYNILHKLNLLLKEEEEPEAKEEDKAEEKPESAAASSLEADKGDGTAKESVRTSKARKAAAPKSSKAKPAEEK